MIRPDSTPRTRANPYRKRINREPSPLLANTVPYATIALASMLPLLFVAPVGAAVPPLGFMMLLGWRLMRPGLMPSWVGLPLGAFDDLFSGQPFGCAILLWSMTMLIFEWIETRWPWRGFWQDWVAAAVATGAYIVLALVFSGAPLRGPLLVSTLPVLLSAILLYPMVAGVVAWFDRIRLLRIREVK